MYCLPYPRSSDVPPLRVPYIANRSSPRELGPDFFFDEDFNIRRGLAAFIQGGTSNRKGIVTESLIQSCLFFGLASKALGRDIRHEEFVERCGGQSPDAWIDLRIPRWFWTELKSRWDHLKETLPSKAFARKKAVLKYWYDKVWLIIYFLDEKRWKMAEDRPEVGLALLSVKMFLYLFAQRFEFRTSRPDLESRSTALLIRRMTENGWCRKRLNFVGVLNLSYPTLYFISSVRPSRGPEEDHRLCTSLQCLVTTQLSSPLHRTAGCQCEDIPVSVDTVATIVEAGGIPLTKIIRSPNGSYKLEVVPYGMGTSRFTAISHVWADRQFGSASNALPQCQVEYLDSVLARLPLLEADYNLRDWCAEWFSSEGAAGEIQRRSPAYNLFWLDSFCIPQDAQHALLKQKAIDSMDSMYAAATNTLIFDAGLQRLDAGQQPLSQVESGRPSFFGPKDEHISDVLAQLCASNWMGRAWTLQEGALSRNPVIQLDGSFLYIRRLWWLEQVSTLSITGSSPGSSLMQSLVRTLLDYAKQLKDAVTNKGPPSADSEANLEPFHDRIRADLWYLVRGSLLIENRGDYARGPAGRAIQFIWTHNLLRSRSTTQSDGLPLIFINLACLDSNAAAQLESPQERMKMLFYSLESVPLELIFSDCERIAHRTVDSWMPREVVPEFLDGNYDYALRLDQLGFQFQRMNKDSAPLNFFLFPSSTTWKDNMPICFPGEDHNTQKTYKVQFLMPFEGEITAPANNGWCILLETPSWKRHGKRRGALFLINRIDGNNVFLQFNCPIRLSDQSSNGRKKTKKRRGPRSVARLTESQLQFMIEKSPRPQHLAASRPQSPAQYSAQLDAIIPFIHQGVNGLQILLLKKLFGDTLTQRWLFAIPYVTFLGSIQSILIEKCGYALMHYAWIQKYQTSTSNTPLHWRWFWTIWNYETPIPLELVWKIFCKLMFYHSSTIAFRPVVIQILLYGSAAYSIYNLVSLCVVDVLVEFGFWLLYRGV